MCTWLQLRRSLVKREGKVERRKKAALAVCTHKAAKCFKTVAGKEKRRVVLKGEVEEVVVEEKSTSGDLVHAQSQARRESAQGKVEKQSRASGIERASTRDRHAAWHSRLHTPSIALSRPHFS